MANIGALCGVVRIVGARGGGEIALKKANLGQTCFRLK